MKFTFTKADINKIGKVLGVSGKDKGNNSRLSHVVRCLADSPGTAVMTVVARHPDY